MEYTPLELAEAYLRSGELDDALEALNEHLASAPDDENARRLRAQVLARIGILHGKADQLDAALADLNAIEAPSVDDVARRVNVLHHMGDQDTAHSLLTEIWAQKDERARDPRVIELLLESLYRRSEPAKAIEILFDLPKTWRWLRWNGDFHALKGDYRVALDYFCSALDQLEESTQDASASSQGFIGNLRGQILLRRAEMYAKIALYAEAEADYADAEKLIPNDTMITFMRGLMVYLRGDHAEAITICKAALENTKPESMRDEMFKAVREDKRYAGLAQELDR